LKKRNLKGARDVHQEAGSGQERLLAPVLLAVLFQRSKHWGGGRGNILSLTLQHNLSMKKKERDMND
jgi:hypothetical protein